MQNYSNKKVAILRGYPQLIDGESTTVDELYRWGLKNEVEVHTFYLHGVWKRKEPKYENGYEHPHTIYNRTMMDEILKEINEEFDLVLMINPAKPHSGLRKEDVRAFHQLYKDISVIKVMCQLNHFQKAINEMPFCWSYINESDGIFNFSDNTWFMNNLVKKLPSKRDRSFGVRIGTDVASYKDYYKNEDRENNFLFVGRFVLYKGIRRMMDIAPAVHKAGFKPEVYGMDTSIGCKTIILNHENCNNLLQPTAPRNANPIVDVHGRVVREEVFELYNKSLFACSLFKFKRAVDKSFYGDRLEYTMIEAIMAGAILVVDKEWAEDNRTLDGTRYIDIPNFAVFMDESYPAEAIDEMKKIAADPELQRLYRDTAYQINLKENDSDSRMKDWMRTLFNLTKDPYKFENDRELVKYLTNSEEKADKFVEIYDEGNLMPMVPVAISENKISIYTGKSGKMIREAE